MDLERGVVADLLPDRSAASFETWLKEHPGVTVVSRDRDGVYAEGGYSGAARAQQVTDRFHLVQALIRAVQDEFAHQRGGLRMPTQEIVGHNSQRGSDHRSTRARGYGAATTWGTAEFSAPRDPAATLGAETGVVCDG